jgi:spore maturation protein CgeB
MSTQLRIVILGLSITSSWGNGHATTYRGWCANFARAATTYCSWSATVPWYATNRDLASARMGRTELYATLEDLSNALCR